MQFPEALVNILVKLGFRAPGEPSRSELRTKIRQVCLEGKRHADAIPTSEERRSRTGEIHLPPVVHGAH